MRMMGIYSVNKIALREIPLTLSLQKKKKKKTHSMMQGQISFEKRLHTGLTMLVVVRC